MSLVMLNSLVTVVVALAGIAICQELKQPGDGQRTAAKTYKEERHVTREENDLMWCVLSMEEYAKCRHFAEQVEKDQNEDEAAFGSYYRRILCKRYTTRDECMKVIDFNRRNSSNIMSVDSGEVFVGGRYHSLVPILRETYSGNKDYYHSVAVVKKGTLPNVKRMIDLRGLKACFAKVGSLAGWTLPIYKLISSNVMEVVDCNNHVKSAIEFFGESCAVDSLRDRYNPLGDNPHKFCELCGSATPGIRCTNRDPYAEYAGALRCLQEKGDIAFINEKTIFQGGEFDPNDFELLCPIGDEPSADPSLDAFASNYNDASDFSSRQPGLSGGQYLTRRPVEQFEECSWGVAPGNAIVVSSAMSMKNREDTQQFLQLAVQRYGQQPITPNRDTDYPNKQYNDYPIDINDASSYDNEIDVEEEMDLPFRIFESSPHYGSLRNLMFSDAALGLRPIKPDDMSYKEYLDRPYGPAASAGTPQKAIDGVRQCGVGVMELCVTSDAEMRKCVLMRTALNAQLLEPKMQCKKAHSHAACMRYIKDGTAHVVVLDAGDVYKAGYQYGLVPVMAEVYNLGTPHYYAVAVTKQRDNSSELIYLKRRNTCHTGIGHAAGWVIPMAWLITNERVRDYGCDSVRAAAEYFSKACAPGAHSAQYQIRNQDDYWEYSHLCDLCHGTAGHYCERNHMEDYYGHTGAFRCLVEGGGHVAFVKHTTVLENCDGKRKEWWARNQLTSDYELLCRDGTRAPARNYKDCYLGKVNSNAIVTNPRIGEVKLNAFINLFKYAQQYYGQKVHDEFTFSMFYSQPPYADLIFQDATQQLVVIPEQNRRYDRYLDREFQTAYSTVECRSGSWIARQTPMTFIFTAAVILRLL